jgi:hypothetical protein
MKIELLLSVGLLFTVGCQPRAFSSESGVASVESGIANIKATNCEIFIDKALMRETHPNGNSLSQTLRLFVKINPSKLDGSVAKVAHYGRSVHSHMYGADERAWSAVELSRFVGSSDYFQMELELIQKDANYSNSYYYEGAFYVETDRGTRYWANAASGPDFRTNQGNWIFSMDNLKGGALTELPVLTYEPDVGGVKKTRDNAGIGRFFNPQGCE